MRLAMLQFKVKLQKCIRIGITIFQTLIWEGISSDISSEITFYGHACIAVKLNFRPYMYIRRYTSPNEIFSTVIP